MKNLYRFLSCVALAAGGFSFSAKAQPAVVKPYPVPAGSLTRGGVDTSLLTVKLTFGAPAANAIATVLLPQGVVYVPGSVAKTTGTASYSIADAGGSARTPQFSISGVTASGDITFSIRRTALCGGTGSGKDTVRVACSGCPTVTEGDALENPYNIYAPSLAIAAPATVNNAQLGGLYSRSINITNGGNGCTDTLRFFIVYPSGGSLKLQDAPTNSITVGGQTLVPSSTSGDTLFYKIFGAAIGGDGKLCNGESITVTEPITVVSCAGSALTTQYGARWGSAASTCQTGTASALVNFAAGTPQLTATIVSQPSAVPTCSGIFTYIAKIKNTGSAAAAGMAVALSNSSTTFTNNDRFFIETDSIRITLPGGMAQVPTGVTTLNAFSVATLPCIHNKPGRVSLGSLASVTLQPGDSILIRWSVNTTCMTGTVCGGGNPQLGITQVNATYTGACSGGPTYTMSSAGTRVGPTLTFSSGNEEYPAQVSAGDCFNIQYVVRPNMVTGYSNTSSAQLPRRYLQGVVTLPAGVTLSSISELNYQYDTTFFPGYPMQVGNQVIFRMRPTSPLAATGVGSTSSSIFTLRLNLCRAASGSTCGDNTFATEFSLVADSGCSPLFVARDCRNPVINFPCAGSCSGGGTSGLRATMGRINFGLPDNNADGRPDSTGTLDFNKVDVNHYRPGDTMRSVSSAIITPQTAPGTISVWNNAYAEWQFNTGTWRPSRPASVTVTRGGTSYTCPSIGIDTLTAGTRFRVKIDSPCFAAQMPFTTGDSIWASADFVYSPTVTISALSGTSSMYSTTVGDFNAVTRTLVSHILYASQSAAPPAGGNIGVVGFSCDSRLYVGYVNGFRHDVVMSNHSATSCNTVAVTGAIQNNVNGLSTGGQFFPGEYRPLWLPDTLVFTTPAGWEYAGNATTPTQFQYTTSYTNLLTYSPSFNILPTVTGSPGTGYQMRYDLKAARQSGLLPFWGTEGAYLRLQFNMRPTCAAPLQASFGIEERGTAAGSYPGASYRYANSFTRTDGFLYPVTTRPSIAVQNNTGVVNGGTANHFWEVQINNTSLVAAPYTWLALEKNGGGIDVDSVVLIPSNAVIAPTVFGSGGKWYGIAGSGGLASQSNQKARVYFRYSSCTTDSLKMSAGFSCGAYPSPDPSAAYCSAVQYLKVVPQPSEIQLSVSRQPGNGSSISLCSTDSTTIIVNSAQAANLIAPALRIFPPTGTNITSPVPVEFPLGSGQWQSLAATPISGGYEIALSGHTGIGSTGMPGTLTTATASARQAKVKLEYTTDCSFVSGRRLVWYGYGQRACGGTAVGDGQNVKTGAATISGATSSTTMSLSMSLPTTLNGSDTVTVSCTAVPTGGATISGDTVSYTLPAGIAFADGFTAGGACAGCTTTVTSGPAASTLVKIALPAGTSAGTNITYSFKASAQGAGCGAMTIDAEAVRSIAGVSCGGTSCGSSSAVIGTASSGITVNKPFVSLDNLSATTWLNYAPGNVAQLRLVYSNNGAQAMAANKYTVEFFCSPGASAPFHSAVLPNALAVGASRVDTFAVPVSNTCTNGDAVTARVRPIMANATVQDLCAPSAASNAMPLPLDALDFSAMLEGTSVALAWRMLNERGVASYHVQRGIDGARFETIARIDAMAATSYAATDKTLPNASVLYYRLQVLNADGSVRYSGTETVHCTTTNSGLTVAPNPAQTYADVVWASAGGDATRVTVRSAAGAVVFSQDVTTVKGTNRLRLDAVKSLSAGTYIVDVASASGKAYARLTVVR